MAVFENVEAFPGLDLTTSRSTVVSSAWQLKLTATDSHTHTEIEGEYTVPVATPRCNYTALNNYRLDFKTIPGPITNRYVSDH